MRILFFLAAWLLSGVASAQVVIEDMSVRPGGDYRVFDIPPPAPPGHGPRVSWGACRIECNEDYRCRAWTYEYPPFGGGVGVCRLKERVSAPAPDPCCVSGVKPTAPVLPSGETYYEHDTARDGDLMRDFVLQKYDQKAWMCEYACLIELDWLTGDRCRSWSFEQTPNKDAICRLFRDETGGFPKGGAVSHKIFP
ncbi:MAG: PAN domain-containing protein [Parvularculaceae bacterium]|nr:PAN domain-containing protein [Parvularculaceae bacterium]